MSYHHHSNLTDVHTGEVRYAFKNDILRSNAIGSCVVVIIFNETLKLAGMAHSLLPGHSNNGIENFKYAGDAIDFLIKKVSSGSGSNQLWCFLVGGANVLKRENDDIALKNVEFAQRYLRQLNIGITCQSTGGTKRRSVEFHMDNHLVYFTVGDSGKMTLWKKN